MVELIIKAPLVKLKVIKAVTVARNAIHACNLLSVLIQTIVLIVKKTIVLIQTILRQSF